MTPTRAHELYYHHTEMVLKNGRKFIFPTLMGGSIKKHMTQDEIDFVHKCWDQLPGSASFASTLLRIVDGQFDRRARLVDSNIRD